MYTEARLSEASVSCSPKWYVPVLFFVLLDDSLSLLTRAYSDFPGDVAFGGEVTAETGRRLLPGSAGCQ